MTEAEPESETIAKYEALIRRFTAGELSAESFSEQYLREFKTEEPGLSEETYTILQRLFGEADAYCADPELRDEWDVDEAELREAALEAASELEGLQA